MKKGCLILGVSLSLLLQSCSASGPDNGIKVISRVTLPAQLDESSGLFCPDAGVLYSLNDSGNTPELFSLNPQGNIVKADTITARNKDWESVTGDAQALYIGDIGNNNGKRKTIQVQVLDKTNLTAPPLRKLIVSYQDNPIDENFYLAHDYDAEALVSAGEKLVLFSKSWKSGIAHVYELSKTQPKQTVVAVAHIEGLPGIVTGGDYDAKHGVFILVGYKVSHLIGLTPFIAKVDRQYRLLSSYELDGFAQVEGVCVAPDSRIWISQEGSFFQGQSLANIDLPN